MHLFQLFQVHLLSWGCCMLSRVHRVHHLCACVCVSLYLQAVCECLSSVSVFLCLALLKILLYLIILVFFAPSTFSLSLSACHLFCAPFDNAIGLPFTIQLSLLSFSFSPAFTYARAAFIIMLQSACFSSSPTSLVFLLLYQSLSTLCFSHTELPLFA